MKRHDFISMPAEEAHALAPVNSLVIINTRLRVVVVLVQTSAISATAGLQRSRFLATVTFILVDLPLKPAFIPSYHKG